MTDGALESSAPERQRRGSGPGPAGAEGATSNRVDDEAALLTSLRAGDERAFERLVVEQGGRLLAVARRLLRNDEDARDCLQECFVQAFRALPRFEGQAKLSTWLHRIVVNAALMKLRGRRARPEGSIESLLPSFHEDGHSTVAFRDWTPGADELLEREEVRALVRAAIDQLPESHRTVLVLRDLEELDTAEAAAALGISPNAVKIRLHRARQALRQQLDLQLREGYLA